MNFRTPPVTDSPAVEVVDLAIRRGGSRRARQVVSGVTFAVPQGSVTGLLGPSGCGKTTLLRAIVGVQRGVTGTVRVLGLPAGSAALRSQIGYVTQAPSVYGDLSVAENLRYFAAVLGVPAASTGTALDLVGLADAADRRVDTLSGGQRSRVSLAAALLGGPRLLVLDEPTVGLDPVLRRDLWARFHELARSGTALLISSHVMDEAARCDDLLLMREGRLLAQGSPDDLRHRTNTDDLEQSFLRLVDTDDGPPVGPDTPDGPNPPAGPDGAAGHEAPAGAAA